MLIDEAQFRSLGSNGTLAVGEFSVETDPNEISRLSTNCGARHIVMMEINTFDPISQHGWNRIKSTQSN